MSHATADMTWARMGRVSGRKREFGISKELSSSDELVRVRAGTVGIQDAKPQTRKQAIRTKEKRVEKRSEKSGLLHYPTEGFPLPGGI